MAVMKKDKITIFKVNLVLSDTLAVVSSFMLAYFARTHLDTRAYYFAPNIWNFVFLAVSLLPLWLAINYFFSLYDRSVFFYRPKEYGRALIVSIISIMAMISYEFFTGDEVFPVRIIAIFFVPINFLMIILGREIVRFIRRALIRSGFGRQKVLIIGSNSRSTDLVQFFHNNIDFGYDTIGMVSKSTFIPLNTGVRHFSSFKEAVSKTDPDILIQTDSLRSEDIYNYAIENHLEYMFVPQQDRLLSQINTIEVVGGLPVIDVKVTKLFGMGRIWKRLMDLTLGWIGLILASPIMLMVAIIMKITAPKDSIFFKQVRLTRFNREFYIYKFRSQKAEFDGLTPEQAFEKMGRPELSKKYREKGDQLDDDPRVTKIGKFIRATSIDELPQLFNVIRGDISLVGPRALIPQEINKSNRKNVILAVKAGVTGLAQVSGRRDISFEERRRLDVYYVQNWSIIFDIQILFKTVVSVIFRKGAK